MADPIGIDSLMAQLIENRVKTAAQHGTAIDAGAAAAGAGTAAATSSADSSSSSSSSSDGE